ncbi:hypothetical protein CHI12_15350 [Terribacillus saccharophilus]|uniref:Transcriptional repressor n=1 Tax=Terribacillus saccharophilus TaxID=361277 RepID=A0A268H9X3_9BACI|nr:Fur family transcriptional regulator [Terribacillus saccharophilus]PAE06681.1 hypothetical protein CHI12_15350 [Terribacillus saccharophilus]
MNRRKALEILKENGYRQTVQRDKLLQIFEKNLDYTAAIVVWKEFNLKFAGASYNTLYRNLYTMVEIGILEMTIIDGLKNFRFHCNAEGHNHHFICKKCGHTKLIEVCLLENVLNVLPKDYTIDNHRFEVYGICPACK